MRKLHLAVDTDHFIHAGDLTDRFSADCESIKSLTKQIEKKVSLVTTDGAYDKNPTYKTLTHYFPEADVVIPPASDATYNKDSHPQHNHNLQEIKTFGRMG